MPLSSSSKRFLPGTVRLALISSLTLGAGVSQASTAAPWPSLDARDSKDKKAKGGRDKEANATGAADCRVKGNSVPLPDLPEASGLAASRRTPGILWSHVDSGATPLLVALDSRGHTKGRVRLSGVTLADWEDVAVANCDGASCVYVADIGDNRGTRKSITVYRFPEPLVTDPSVAPAAALQGVFPDGPQDSEAVFVLGASEIFVVTKGDRGPIALYRFPAGAKAGGASTLQKVGILRSGKVARENWVTGASASPDGRWVVLRTHGTLTFHDASRLTSGDFGSALSFSVAGLKEPQGEGVAFGPDGAVFLAGEGGGGKAAGTFNSLVCNLPATRASSVQ